MSDIEEEQKEIIIPFRPDLKLKVDDLEILPKIDFSSKKEMKKSSKKLIKRKSKTLKKLHKKKQSISQLNMLQVINKNEYNIMVNQINEKIEKVEEEIRFAQKCLMMIKEILKKSFCCVM